MKKTTQQLIDDYLESGGKIDVLDTVEEDYKYKVGNLNNRRASLMTLDEAEFMFGVKTTKKKKSNKSELASIDMNLIPDKIKNLILNGKDKTKEEN